jgi:uncharacterized membrane protein
MSSASKTSSRSFVVPQKRWHIPLRSMLLVSLCTASLTGCANMSPTQQSALSGGAIGAAGGAVIGTIVGGSPALGAAIGGATGAAAGALLRNGR